MTPEHLPERMLLRAVESAPLGIGVLDADLREQGRIGPHPVAPDKPSWGARRIETEDDVRDVIVLMRMNYDRVVERYGLPVEA